MSDVIREVTIRAKVELLDQKLPAPDLSGLLKQTDAITKGHKDLLEIQRQVTKQAEASRDAMQKAHEGSLRHIDAFNKAREKSIENEKKLTAEFQKSLGGIREATQDLVGQFGELAKATAEQAKAVKLIGEEAKKAAEVYIMAERDKARETGKTTIVVNQGAIDQRNLNDAFLRTGESIRTLTDGTFAFARGLALVSAEGRDLDQFVRQLASIQGKFDLLRGSVDVLRGGVETFRNFGPAAVGVSRSLAPVIAALGPQGLLVTGISAAGVAAAVLWRTFGEQAESATDRAVRAVERFQAAQERASRTLSINLARDAAKRENQTDRERIASLQGSLSRLAAPADVAGLADRTKQLTLSESLIERRRSQFRNTRFGRANAARDDFNAVQDLRARLRSRGVDLRALETPEGFASLAADRDLLGGRLGSAIKTAQERQRLLRELRGSQRSLFDRQDRLRGREIDEAGRSITDITGRRDRVSEQLAIERERQAEQQRQRVLELQALSGPERERVRQGLGDVQSQTLTQLQELAKRAPLNAGQAVEDERLRRIDPALVPQREDQAKRLEEAVAGLTDELKAAREQRDTLAADDGRLDAAANRTLSQIEETFNTVTDRLADLQQAQADLGTAQQ